jgi:hypothetical protein
MKLVCQICGSTKTANDKAAVCQYFCYWTLEGWLGWHGKRKMIAVRNVNAMLFTPGHVGGKLSYPKMIAFARDLGWEGRENAGTMSETA